jgi:hypothetical protein
MTNVLVRAAALLSLIVTMVAMSACGDSATSASKGVDEQVVKLGTSEITAKLIEVPEGAVFKRDLYDYATILKYEVIESHRGSLVKGSTIYVGHYNPFKARSAAADKRVKEIGGNLREFTAGSVHRMALEEPIEDKYLGGIVDKYFGQHQGVTYWAVWTNRAD